MRAILFLLIIPALFSSTCKTGKRGQSNDGLKVRFEIKTFQKTEGDCKTPNGSCAQIDIVFPWVIEGEAAVKKAINERILRDLIENFTFEDYKGELTERSMEQMADTFLLEWKKSVESESELSPAGWEISITGETGLQTSKMAAVTLGVYSYAGGAHPNTYVSLHNFDLGNGKRLSWQDIVTDTSALKILSEKHFKKARELPPNVNLSGEGYFWGEPFSLPQNFEIQEEGIYFWYNPYEAASYAQGPTDFLITYKELGSLVRKERIF